MQLDQLEGDVVRHHEVLDRHQHHNVKKHFQFQYRYNRVLLNHDAIHQTKFKSVLDFNKDSTDLNDSISINISRF